MKPRQSFLWPLRPLRPCGFSPLLSPQRPNKALHPTAHPERGRGVHREAGRRGGERWDWGFDPACSGLAASEAVNAPRTRRVRSSSGAPTSRLPASPPPCEPSLPLFPSSPRKVGRSGEPAPVGGAAHEAHHEEQEDRSHHGPEDLDPVPLDRHHEQRGQASHPPIPAPTKPMAVEARKPPGLQPTISSAIAPQRAPTRIKSNSPTMVITISFRAASRTGP